MASKAEDGTSNARLLTDQELVELGLTASGGLPLDDVRPNPANPRKDLLEIDALADNIKAFGLLQPVTVRKREGHYELLGGHRRFAAFQHLRKMEPHDPKWRTIPAVIRSERDDDRALQMLISGQIHISAWKPKEEAAALERLVQSGRNVSEIAQLLHKTHGWASKRLRVYSDSVLSGFVQTGKLAPSIAEELLPVPDVEIRRSLAEQAVAKGWSQTEIKGQVRALRLDLQLTQIGRLTRQLLDVLSTADPSRIPIDTSRDLWTLYGRIEKLATGRAPKFPSIEAAQRVAGINPNAKPRSLPRRSRTKASPT